MTSVTFLDDDFCHVLNFKRTIYFELTFCHLLNFEMTPYGINDVYFEIKA